MRHLELPQQEKLLELLGNKFSAVGSSVADPTRASVAVCNTIRRYRHKVVLDLKRLQNLAIDDPDNIGNQMKELRKELRAQNKIRTAHEQTIKEQKKLIDELMAQKKNPVMDRVRRSVDSPLPPINKKRPESAYSRISRPSTPRSPLPMGNSSMFELTLGSDKSESDTKSPVRRGGPMHRPPGRSMVMNNNIGGRRGSRSNLGFGGPVFGGGRGGRPGRAGQNLNRGGHFNRNSYSRRSQYNFGRFSF